MNVAESMDMKISIKIVEHQNTKISEARHSPLNPDRELKPTFHNYVTELAMHNNLSLTQTSISNTNTRFAAKHAIRGAVNNIILVANTHFVQIDEVDIDIGNELKEVMQ